MNTKFNAEWENFRKCKVNSNSQSALQCTQSQFQISWPTHSNWCQVYFRKSKNSTDQLTGIRLGISRNPNCNFLTLSVSDQFQRLGIPPICFGAFVYAWCRSQSVCHRCHSLVVVLDFNLIFVLSPLISIFYSQRHFNSCVSSELTWTDPSPPIFLLRWWVIKFRSFFGQLDFGLEVWVGLNLSDLMCDLPICDVEGSTIFNFFNFF